jgi:WD40 repeat protein
MTRIAERAPAEHTPIVLDAFVSYARRDADRIMAIVEAARARGRTMWVDIDDIPAGAPWRTELGTAIEAANAVVCCVSPAWLASEECRREYLRAVELGKRLIPLQISPVDDPPAGLGALQWITAGAASAPDAVVDAVLAAIDTDPERVREHTHWLSRALRWDGHGREQSLLLRGRDLRAAEDWMARPGVDPSPVPLQTQFVAASRTAERRRLRTTITATVTALVLTLALAITAVVQWREAVSQRDQAQSRALAVAALSQLDVDPERSLLLARAALASAPTDQAVVALRTSLDRSRVRVRVAAHPEGATGAAWSPDGRTVITAGDDGSVAAWDASTGASRGRLVLEPGPVTSLEAATGAAVGIAVDTGGRLVVWGVDDTGTLVQRAEPAASGVTVATISGDGRVVAATTADGTARLWTVEGAALPTARWTTSRVDSVALSADGGTVLLGTRDGTALVGPTDAATPLRTVHPSSGVWLTQLSSDGAVMLVIGHDGSVSMRRVDDGSELLRSSGGSLQVTMDSTARHVVMADEQGRVDLATVGGGRTTLLAQGGGTGTASFSPDGALVQVGRDDGAISVWRAADQKPVVDLRGARDQVPDAEFSPDGQRLVSRHDGGEIRVWALPDRPLLLPADVEPGSMVQGTGVTFTPDGSHVRTVTSDGHVGVWDARTAAETPPGFSCATQGPDAGCPGVDRDSQDSPTTHVRHGPDGALVVTSVEDGPVVVRDAATAAEVARVAPAEDAVDALAFSVDGRLLALGDRGGRVRVVDPRTGEVRAAHDEAETWISAVAFTPDGRLLIGDSDGVVRLWDAATRTDRIVARTGSVFDLAVDGTGRTGAVGGDSAVVLLDLVGDRPPRTVPVRGGVVRGVAFTPNGSMLVSGGQDGTVRVWEVGSGQQAATFDHPGGDVTDIAVDRTGRRIAAISVGGGGAIFECRVCGPPDELAALAAQQSTRDLTAEERTLFGLPPSQ